MVLTQEELRSLVEARNRSPHELLGMHALGDASGLVVRVLAPKAVKVEIQPVHEKDKPAIQLERMANTDLFEGLTRESARVYAYDLVITDQAGNVRRTRDPYSFLPTLGEADLYLFGKGDERRIYDKLGSQLRTIDGVAGASFAVWAPNAQRVSVVGDFNEWDGRPHQMRQLGLSGVWEIFIPGLGEGAHYKFEVRNRQGKTGMKTDPYGFFFETPPKNAAIIWNTRKFKWSDKAWLKERAKRNPLREPASIYEVHLGSWRKKSISESLSYRELAVPLIDYVKQLGFTHVEFMPVAEHAFYPSWGYQVTGFYAPTSRYGTPEDFQYLVNALHAAGIGVIIDWVPAHFPRDDWALARFDGTGLYEHEDPRKGAHQDWGTLIFNYSRHEVCNFLTANALFWCDRFHIDGLRVDAVASMLYLDYSRKEGQWIPNQYGGRENLEAIEFIRQFNYLTHTEFPGVMTIAEESTAWPLVTRPPYLGGLGFSFKWNMGWMHDTLGYFGRDPIHRKYHQNDLTFAMLYHHNENFILPLSHDEVVHGKGSLLGRMPGDDWRRFANVRTLLAYQWLFPGKILLFMGCEFGQSGEWDANAQLNWALLQAGPYHIGLQRMVQDLNKLYLAEAALWRSDYDPKGFFWIDASDQLNSVLSFVRQDAETGAKLLVILNLTPVPRLRYRVGFPRGGTWREVLNTDAEIYGGTNVGNLGEVVVEEKKWHGQLHSAELTLPPLSVIVFRPEPDQPKVETKGDAAAQPQPTERLQVTDAEQAAGRSKPGADFRNSTEPVTHMAEVYHALGLHMHQPLGNLVVLHNSSERWEARQILWCYDRPTRMLEGYEDVARLHLSFSGTLLKQLEDGGVRQTFGDVVDIQGFLNRYRRSNIEFLGSGLYHPVYPLIPPADWDAQTEWWLGLGRHLLGRESFPGFWPPEMGFCMEMIPMLQRHGFKYVIVDSIYLKPKREMRWEELRYRPYLACHDGAQIIVVPRDRELSNAQLSGVDPGWFQHEVYERTKHCDFPALVTTWTDGENGGWFRAPHVESGFWGYFYCPILDRYRAGTLGFTPIHISQYLEKYPPQEEVEVHRGAWNTEHHWGGDFTQWTGSLLQKKSWDEVQRASDYYWQVKGALEEQKATAADSEEARQLVVRAYDHLLTAETSCNFYWGSRWVHRSFDELEQAYYMLDTAMSQLRRRRE